MRIKLTFDISERTYDAVSNTLTVLERLLDAVENTSEQGPKLVFYSARLEEGQIFEGEIKMAQMETQQQTTVTARPVNRRGRPARIERGSASWESSDTSVVEIIENPDNELEATIRSVNEGEAMITLRADAQPGEGVKELIGTLAIVVSDTAVAFELQIDTPVDASEAPNAEPVNASTAGGQSSAEPVNPPASVSPDTGANTTGANEPGLTNEGNGLLPNNVEPAPGGPDSVTQELPAAAPGSGEGETGNTGVGGS